MKTESQPMQQNELGRFVCVPADTCLHSPHITINSDGVWTKTGQQWSSAHRDCFEARQTIKAAATARIHKAAPGKREGYCDICGQRIKRVPGGQGPTWVHADTGAVVAPNPNQKEGEKK